MSPLFTQDIFCSRQQLEATKLHRLNVMFAEVLPANSFYREKFSECTTPVQSFKQFADFPFTTKSELVGREDSVSALSNSYEVSFYRREARAADDRIEILANINNAICRMSIIEENV